ncbi:hypothetical protein DUNSADRAFT_7449 [Dunaliella salina]|uniref:Encoded protein n=1 Tax=Dunaliella salina TaxID=3046 RepID=A0ABQ7GLC3_DUNSA|nr:hypothetical protein DUNSADRAFT_7449 [Dunaliella salina]|eukprot:KAF5835414.1 hypothetical protein DUNSADRAFT_7449 [Dunaliella salina]
MSSVETDNPILKAAYGKSIFEAAAENPIPDNAWEFHIRKNLNDAAYNSLKYVPVCCCTPVCAKCNNPKYMWTRK